MHELVGLKRLANEGALEMIAKDSILSLLTELRVQIIATIAENSFRSSTTPDQMLSFFRK